MIDRRANASSTSMRDRGSVCILLGIASLALTCTVALAQDTAKLPTQNQSSSSQAASPSGEPDAVDPNVSASQSSPQPAQPLSWSNPDPNAHATVNENTVLRVMTNQPVSTRQTRTGAGLMFTLSEDVVVDDVLIIPRGATVHGTVVESRQAGSLTGSPDLVLKLTSLEMGGRSYPLYTYQLKVTGASKTKPTETKVKGGAVIGAVVGGIFSGSAKGDTTAVGKLAGMGTGAALGAGVGAALSAATPGPILSIPAESQMDFYLAAPISVIPPGEKEAKRLSEGFRRGGPVLYVRGETP